MGKEKAERKDRKISFRLTASEWEQVQADMRGRDYLSTTRYIRETLLRRRSVPRSAKVTDRAIMNEINEISKKITRIGSNYNQVVKKYNTSCASTRKNGDPVISTNATIFYIEKLTALTKELRDAHEELVKRVASMGIAEW